ncbi:MAG: MFS transporter [Congregibacter sp.]
MPEVTASAPGLRSMFLSPGLLIAGVGAFALSTLFSAMKPVLLTRLLEETVWSESTAGMVVAVPFVGIAISSLLFYLRPPNVALRKLAYVFGGLLVLLELLSAALFEQSVLLLGLQLTAGFCVGALMAATSRLLALSDTPDESFGFVDMMAVALMSAMVSGASISVAFLGVKGGYLFAAALSSLYAMFVISYREPPLSLSHHNAEQQALTLGVRPLAVVLMGVVFVTASGLGFVFLFSLAARLGMDYQTAGLRLGALLLASAAACQLGGWCSGRYGPRYPLLGAFIACALGWWIAVHTHNEWVFLVALVPALFSLQFNFPILLALAGSLDTHGRWAGIAAPLITSGFAWAAICAGLLVEHYGFEMLGWATALGMLLCICLLWPATRMTQAD